MHLRLKAAIPPTLDIEEGRTFQSAGVRHPAIQLWCQSVGSSGPVWDVVAPERTSIDLDQPNAALHECQAWQAHQQCNRKNLFHVRGPCKNSIATLPAMIIGAFVARCPPMRRLYANARDCRAAARVAASWIA
jgi:hypothetical protein